MEENQEKKITNEKTEKEENPNQNVEEIKQEQETVAKEQNLVENQARIEENQTETAIVEYKKKKRRKGSYITGTIGAIIGGSVAAMAWILTYVFFNHMVIPIFGTLIPLGAYLGYKIFRGRIGKIFPIIITIISLLIIILTTAIICPVILIIESGFPVTLENLGHIYHAAARADVRKVVVEDIIAGSAFTIIGIIATIVFFIRKDLQKLISEEERKIINEKAIQQLKEKSEIIKKTCVTLNCMKKENAISKKLILRELKNTYNIKIRKCKKYFSVCKLAKLLKKHKGKYYYDENDEENKIKEARKINSKYKVLRVIKFIIKLVITVVLLAGIIIGIGICILINTQSNYIVPNTEIELTTNGLQDLYGTQEQITEAFGEQIASYYDFIVIDKAEKYEVDGKVIDKIYYEGTDIDSIIQADKEYCIQITNEEMSETTEKKFGDTAFKSYNYSYNGNNNERYLAVVYLHESENSYLWIFAYADSDVDVTQMDKVLEKMFK